MPDPIVAAAIDIGSNSSRLLIVDDAGAALHRASVVTRLGAGVDQTRRLAEDAIERELDCLAGFARDLKSFSVNRFRVFATSACRDAENRDVFFNQVEQLLGVAPELLSGVEEGQLSFSGATSGLLPRKNTYGDKELDLVIDIGGGSTEFIVGMPGEPPLGAFSVDMGCVRITEQFLHSDPPSPEELSSAISVMQAHVDDVIREVPEVKQATRLIGVGGSIQTAAAIEIGMQTYDRARLHHFELSKAAVEDVLRTVATENRVDRAFNPGLPADRVDTVVGGTAILACVMRQLKLGMCLVSTNDLLEASALGLLGHSG